MPLSRQDYFYVGLQGLLFLAYALVGRLYTFSVAGGLVIPGWLLFVMGLLLVGIALVQLNTSLSPFPRPLPNGKLVTSGAFRLARHPIYAGILWAALGNALRTGSGGQLVVTGLLALLFYFKSAYEERLLDERYPEYAAYRQQTGRFWPLTI